MTNHLALVTTETLPCMPAPCAGGGIRLWGLGERLRKAGINCTYFVTEQTPGADQIPNEVPLRTFKPENLQQSLKEESCDAVLFEQWQPMTFLSKRLDIPTFVDLPGPLVLEYYWRDSHAYYQHMVDKINCLSRADYAICALERQYGYYANWLLWSGLSPENERLTVVPFLCNEMPQTRGGFIEDEPIFFWGGLFWPWQKREKSFETITQTLTRIRRGQLVVAGAEGNEDYSKVNGQSYADHPHVSWLGNLVFSDYIIEMKRATLAIDLCQATEERRLSSDLRTGTALWAGTPCLVTPASPWAKTIEENNAGWVIDYHNTKALAKLIEKLALEREDIVAKRRGAKVISESISEKELPNTLLQWLKKPTMREESPTFFEAREVNREQQIDTMRQEINILTHERDSLQHDLSAIRNKSLFKLYQSLAFWKK